MKDNKVLSSFILIFIFASVFLGTFFYKRLRPSGLDKGLSLAQLSQHLNEVGYVGWELLLCADDNRCPPNYDPQSAMGLLPFVTFAEAESFSEIERTSKVEKNLSGLMDGVALCSKYCSCAVWERFLASDQGKDFQVDFEKNNNDGTCVPWEQLSEGDRALAQRALNYIESLQN